jgi:hypothetical protein
MSKLHASIDTLPYLSVRKSIFPHHVMEMVHKFRLWSYIYLSCHLFLSKALFKLNARI